MNAQEIVNALQNRKGQHVQITWQRQVKTLKTFAGVIAKRTTAYVRTGIDYANLSSVKAGIASGEREEVQSLPWGQWRAGAEKYIIDHNNQEYVRLYPASFDNLKPRVEWTLNGNPVAYDTISSVLLANERPKQDEEKAECFTVKAASIVSIGE